MVTVSVATWAQEWCKNTTENKHDEYGIYAGEGADIINYNELKDSREGVYLFGAQDRSEEVLYYYDFGVVVSIKYLPKEQIYEDFQKKLLSIKEKDGTLNFKSAVCKRGNYGFWANEVGVVFCNR